MDTPGPICRSVADVAIVMDAVTGTDERDPCPFAVKGAPTRFYEAIANIRDLSGKVLGIPTNFFFDRTDYEVERVFREAVDRLRALGAEIREITSGGLDLIPETSTNLMFPEAAWAHRKWYPVCRDLYQKDISKKIVLKLIR